ncbi:unnamed protein product [Symbiodinium sp. CCMP2592]|nr:unnamed protein product [Symbiodinium sp. CCMP2592]
MRGPSPDDVFEQITVAFTNRRFALALAQQARGTRWVCGFRLVYGVGQNVTAALQPASSEEAVAKQLQAPFTVDTVHVKGGFKNPSLNTVFYLDPHLQIGSRATYWDDSRRWFMYYQAPMKRWAISIRDASTGEDMLENAKGGGLCGFAVEVDKNRNAWQEFFDEKWVTVEIDIRKLCTGKRAPPVLPRVPERHAPNAKKLQVPTIPTTVKQEPEPVKVPLAPTLPTLSLVGTAAGVKEEMKEEESSESSLLQESMAFRAEAPGGRVGQVSDKPREPRESKEQPQQQQQLLRGQEPKEPSPESANAAQELQKQSLTAKEAEKMKRRAEKEERARQKESVLKEKIRKELLAKAGSERGGDVASASLRAKVKKKEKKDKKDKTGRADKPAKRTSSPKEPAEQKAAFGGTKNARGRRKAQDNITEFGVQSQQEEEKRDEPAPSCTEERPEPEPAKRPRRPRWNTTIAATWPT